MSRILWLVALLVLAVTGWGAIAWLMIQTSPTQPLARLALVAALGVGVFAVVGLVAYLAGPWFRRGSGQLDRYRLSRQQGTLWAGFMAALLLLRLSGEMSAITLFVVLVSFLYLQFAGLGGRA